MLLLFDAIEMGVWLVMVCARIDGVSWAGYAVFLMFFCDSTVVTGRFLYARVGAFKP
jgi:hypothetical protein